MSLSIELLPQPVIEYIFSYLSPYRDLKNCLLVNKTWYELVYGTIRRLRRDFHNAVTARNVSWEHSQAENCPTISRRYSHSSCICGDSMFVFGGCTTACTTFNDLWRLDLGIRSWIRPLATGTYPPPKACASMVCYKDSLILFGGWTHTSPYPLHQAWHIFNHIHIYNTKTNRWNQVVTSTDCPGMAGHTATMVGDKMVIFGGLHCQSGWGPFTSSSEVWVLDVKTMTWKKQRTNAPAPHPRYGHSQINIDSNHLLIVGGCGGPNMLFSDIWLLTISDNTNSVWEWKEIEILQKDNAAPQLTFHPACKVDSKVVVLSKAQWSRTLPSCLPQLLRTPTRTWIPPRADVFARPEPKIPNRPAETELNVNGRKGVLKRHLQRTLVKRAGSSNNTSSSDDEDLHPNTFVSKKGIIASNARTSSPTIDLDQPGPSTSYNEASICTVVPLPVPKTDSGSLTDQMGDLLMQNQEETISDAQRSITKAQIAADTPMNPSPDIKPTSRNVHPITGPRPMLSMRPNAWRNRQRQLEGLDRMEQRIKNLRSGVTGRITPGLKPLSSSLRSSVNVSPKNPMCLYVLDISKVLEEGRVSWIPPQVSSSSGLEEIILYSLVLGRGELVMFGGIQKDLNSDAREGEKAPQTVSNSVHFISAFKYII